MRSQHSVSDINGLRMYLGGVSDMGKDKVINQDTFKVGSVPEKDIAYIIVADGLGSCKYSNQGAERITEIIEKWVVNQLPQYGCLSENVGNILIKRVVEGWKAAYDYDIAHDYDTTVNFAVYYKKQLLVGGIGDGMLIVETDGVNCKDYVKEKNLFSNITDSMCSIDIEELLQFNIVPINEKAEIIVSTDGIADDLIPKRKYTLPDYFAETILEQGIEALQNEIVEWICDWETDGHSDDKTICYS